jgi:serine/threonine protein kinase
MAAARYRRNDESDDSYDSSQDDSRSRSNGGYNSSEEWSTSGHEENDNDAIHVEFDKERVGRHSTVFSSRNVRLGSDLGEGAFGRVRKGYVSKPPAFGARGRQTNTSKKAAANFAELEDGDLVAVKVISKKRVVKRNLQTQLAQEITVHRALIHPNIVRFYDFSEDVQNVYFYLEFAPKGDLLDYVKRFSPRESDLSNILYQVGQAIAFCHSYGVVHRDLKPENVLMDQNHVPKLTDFGYCDRIGQNGYCKNPLFCGTTDYMAPEMLNEDPCSYPLDVWAFGVMIYDLLCGETPFQSKTRQETYEKIRACQVPWTKGGVQRYIRNCKRLLQSIFVMPPEDRPTMEEILQDNWFQQ